MVAAGQISTPPVAALKKPGRAPIYSMNTLLSAWFQSLATASPDLIPASRAAGNHAGPGRIKPEPAAGGPRLSDQADHDTSRQADQGNKGNSWLLNNISAVKTGPTPARTRRLPGVNGNFKRVFNDIGTSTSAFQQSANQGNRV